MLFGWWKAGMDLALLGFEAQGVVAQRMTLLTLGGPAAMLEAERMVTEKIVAASEAALLVASGASDRQVIGSFRRKVRANAVRLGRC